MPRTRKPLLAIAAILALATLPGARAAEPPAPATPVVADAGSTLDTVRNYERDNTITSREALPARPQPQDWREREAWRQRYASQ